MMANGEIKDLREDSLQTHGLGSFVAVAIESFIALNSAQFLVSISALIVSAFKWLDVWLCAVIVLVIGGYVVALVYRRDRIGYLYAFCVGLGAAIALRHRL